ISDYNAPADLWQVLFDPGIDPRLWDFPSNEATTHGTRFEPLARILYERLTGNSAWETGLWMHPEACPLWLHSSPDGFVREAVFSAAAPPLLLRRLMADGVGMFLVNGGLEIKCPL